MSHLLFADDTLVFYENSQEQMTYLSWILIWFKALLVLRIKLDKSELISIGKVTDVDSLTTELGCKVRKLPYIYLGLSLGASYGSEPVWDVISRYVLGQAYIFFRQHNIVYHDTFGGYKKDFDLMFDFLYSEPFCFSKLSTM